MRTLLWLLVLPACDFYPKGTEDALYSPGHCDYSPTALAFDAVDSLLGFSAYEFSLHAENVGNTQLVWEADGATVELSAGLSLDHDSVARMDGVWVPAENAGDSGVFPAEDSAQDCPSTMAIDGVWSLATADGALNEALPVAVSVVSGSEGSAFVSLDYGALVGSYVPTELDPADWDEVRLDFAGSFGAGQTGTLTLFASRTEPGEQGDDGVASATQQQVAHWPAE